MSGDLLPIQALICNRSDELGLSAVELVRRCSFKNIAKGLRRLEQLCQGNFRRSLGLIAGLPVALEVPGEVVKTAIEASQRQLREAEETAWRTGFRPHAMIVTERKIPQPIFVAAVLGVDRLLRLDFDPALGPVTYVTQAMDLKQRLARWKGVLPAYGRPVGFIVKSAVRFDLEGKAVEMLDQAYRLGVAQFCIGKRPISFG